MGHFFFSIGACFLLLSQVHYSEAGAVGLNYGMLGDNLPPPSAVVSLLKSRNVGKVRLFEPNAAALNALSGSGIAIVLGTLNQDLPKLASDPSFAQAWVRTNVLPYASAVRYISAGNEVIPGDLAAYVLPAMQNLDAASKAAALAIPVTTAVSTAILGSSYPPSAGRLGDPAIAGPIAAFLAAHNYPLLLNAYPYFAYAGSAGKIPLGYALGGGDQAVVRDGALGYTNLFDAIVDAAYAALEKAGAPRVEVVVTETGWPSAGNGEIATKENAAAYVNNVISHVSGTMGTPRRPGKNVETYIFAMFNEDEKPAGTEQNFGLFYPNMTEVYHVNL